MVNRRLRNIMERRDISITITMMQKAMVMWKEYLEMNDENVITALSLDEQNDFCDTSSHFNIYGTEKISSYLADYMEEKKTYTDQRIQGTGINAYWNQLYETYLDYKNSDTE